MSLSERVTPEVMRELRNAIDGYIAFADSVDNVRNLLGSSLSELTKWVRQGALEKGEVHNDELEVFEEEFREWLDTWEAKNVKVQD